MQKQDFEAWLEDRREEFDQLVQQRISSGDSQEEASAAARRFMERIFMNERIEAAGSDEEIRAILEEHGQPCNDAAVSFARKVVIEKAL